MKTLTTHNGAFHADEVLAIAIMQELTTLTFDITRTYDVAVIATSDYVVGVGGSTTRKMVAMTITILIRRMTIMVFLQQDWFGGTWT